MVTGAAAQASGGVWVQPDEGVLTALGAAPVGLGWPEGAQGDPQDPGADQGGHDRARQPGWLPQDQGCPGADSTKEGQGEEPGMSQRSPQGRQDHRLELP